MDWMGLGDPKENLDPLEMMATLVMMVFKVTKVILGLLVIQARLVTEEFQATLVPLVPPDQKVQLEGLVFQELMAKMVEWDKMECLGQGDLTDPLVWM